MRQKFIYKNLNITQAERISIRGIEDLSFLILI